ncbi:MAG: hypothetical protein FWF77_01055 [Defluviitaleaceae bacterium]|nr:hypothetical protein [Defluviitaleaceae bacterium]
MNYEVDVEKFNLFLDEKKLPNTCPLCATDALEMDIDVVFGLAELPIIPGESIAIPLLPTTCKNCGYTAFINPMVKGLLKSSDGGEQNG